MALVAATFTWDIDMYRNRAFTLQDYDYIVAHNINTESQRQLVVAYGCYHTCHYNATKKHVRNNVLHHYTRDIHEIIINLPARHLHHLLHDDYLCTPTQILITYYVNLIQSVAYDNYKSLRAIDVDTDLFTYISTSRPAV